MSSEDMQRTIDFILDQQAQFATNIQVLRETQIQLTISQAKAEVRMDRIEEVVLKTVGVVESLADGLDRTDGLVGALVEAQAQTQASLRELAAAQAQTEASLRELATAVERYISKGSQGDSV
jgi:chromosome segregation ATPase